MMQTTLRFIEAVKAADFVLHLIESTKFSLADLPDPFNPFKGEPLAVVRDPATGTATIGSATVVDPDRPASNGVIHGVSTLPTPTQTP